MSATPRHVIGITGLPSSGKGEVAGAFIACAEERGWQAAHLSFSDCIKDEARALGCSNGQIDRALLRRIGTEMREREGPGALALRIARKLAAWPPPRPQVFIVEALRHPGEVEALRGAYGDRFILVGIRSDLETIARRLIDRARPDESREAMQSERRVLRLLKEELRGAASPQAPQVGATLALADETIENNGTLEELRRAAARVFARLA